MTSLKMMRNQIKEKIDITKLKFMRDTGLDMVVTKFKDFTETDKLECVNLINDRIIELGGTV